MPTNKFKRNYGLRKLIFDSHHSNNSNWEISMDANSSGSNFDEEWNIYIISWDLPPQYLVNTGGNTKEWLHIGESW